MSGSPCIVNTEAKTAVAAMPKQVLIIEDDPAILGILADKIAEAGFSVLKAQDGQHGLALALEVLPDLILLDLLIPKLSGLDVLEKLRANTRSSHIPVLVLSNLNDDESLNKTLARNNASLIIKSNTPLESIVDKVSAILLDASAQ